MPRTLAPQRYYDRVRSRAARLAEQRLVDSWQAGQDIGFTDYFPDVAGTRPEKMVFNELAKRHINFSFGVYFGDIPFTTDRSERYRPDFLLPDYRIVIDVQGVYWHTRVGKFESDYIRAAMLEAAGWRFYGLTDTQILAGVEQALDTIPELVHPTITGNMRVLGDRPISPIAPIIARIKARPEVVRTRFKLKQGAGPRAKAAWVGEKAARREIKVGRLFDSENDFDPAYLQTVRQFGQDWRVYLQSLTDYFTEFPEARYYYPEFWQYWNKWKNWWYKFSPIEHARY